MLLPIEYLLPSKLGKIHDPALGVLTSWLSKLEKLQENQLVAQDLVVSK
jgi:hypothetical protein